MVFKDLGFSVDEIVCEPNDDVEKALHSVASRDYGEYNLFVCFVQSSVIKDLIIEGFGGRVLSVTELLARFSSRFHLLQRERPKIFIIQGHQTTATFGIDEPRYERSLPKLLFKESVSIKLPDENFLCLFFPYRKGYISTLLSVIKSQSSEPREILDILSEAKKSFYEKNHITIPDPVHNLTGPVYLN